MADRKSTMADRKSTMADRKSTMADRTNLDPGDRGDLGIVIAGAGARGAYEIGALSVLVPWLREHGETPKVVVGTSAGAINAVLVAALASAPDPEAAAELAVASWRSIGRADVFRSIAVTSPGVFTRYLATVLGLARPPLDEALGVTSLLDPAPLRATLAELAPWRHLHSAVRSGTVRSVAVVTTSYTGGSTAVFVETADRNGLPPDDDELGVQYHRARLCADHVMASAAIPLAFPPVRLPAPSAGSGASGNGGGWHFDGGARLNAPIKPSLALGADHLVIVATHPLPDVAAPPPDDDRSPDVVDVAASVVTSVLVDRMAQDVLRAKYGGIPLPGGYDYTLLTRLLGGPEGSHAELMSFLLFDPDFIDLLIDAGQRDAAAAVHAALPGDLFRLSHRGPVATATATLPAR